MGMSRAGNPWQLLVVVTLAATLAFAGGGCSEDDAEECFERSGEFLPVTTDTTTSDHLEASMSPDGTRILFSTDFWRVYEDDKQSFRDLAIIDAPLPGEFRTPAIRLFDVGNCKRLRLRDLQNDDGSRFNPDDPNVLSNRGQPTWHPDGQRFACFVNNTENRPRIYVGRLLFDQVTQQDMQTAEMALIDDVGLGEDLQNNQYFYGAPAFSPDGQWIAYARYFFKPGDPDNDIPDRIENTAIYAHNLGDGRTVKVSQGATLETDPSWSPDGGTIAFASTRDGFAGTLDVYTIPFNPDVADPGPSDGALRLTNSSGGADDKVIVGSFDPTFLSTGSIVYVSTQRAPCTSLRDRNLWIMDAAGGGQRVAFFSRFDDHYPAPQPLAGNSMVFSSRENQLEEFRGNKTDLWVLRGFN
jgi:Tol biopolymer transport system component